MSGCLIAKICLGLSVITTIIYTIAFASPAWIQKDFAIDVPGFALGLPAPYNASMIPVTVSSSMGLLASCDDISIWVAPGMPPKNKEDCGSDGAKDWQYAAAGCGIAGLVMGVFALILSTTVVFLNRRPYYNKLRGLTVLCYMLTCGLIIVPIVLYKKNKEFQVKPPLPNMVEYDLYWAFWVAVACVIMYAILVILHIVQIIVAPENEEPRKDPSANYQMDNKGLSHD